MAAYARSAKRQFSARLLNPRARSSPVFVMPLITAPPRPTDYVTFGRQIVGNALVHRRETEQVPALYLTRFACGGPDKLSRALAVDAGASDRDGLNHCRILP